MINMKKWQVMGKSDDITRITQGELMHGNPGITQGSSWEEGLPTFVMQ